MVGSEDKTKNAGPLAQNYSSRERQHHGNWEACLFEYRLYVHEATHHQPYALCIPWSITVFTMQMGSWGAGASIPELPVMAFTCRISQFKKSFIPKQYQSPKDKLTLILVIWTIWIWYIRAAPTSSYQMSVKIHSRLLNLADPVLIRLAFAQHEGRASLWWRVSKDTWWDFFMEDGLFYPQRLMNRGEKISDCIEMWSWGIKGETRAVFH